MATKKELVQRLGLAIDSIQTLEKERRELRDELDLLKKMVETPSISIPDDCTVSAKKIMDGLDRLFLFLQDKRRFMSYYVGLYLIWKIKDMIVREVENAAKE